jgi:hypothetical protein
MVASMQFASLYAGTIATIFTNAVSPFCDIRDNEVYSKSFSESRVAILRKQSAQMAVDVAV